MESKNLALVHHDSLELLTAFFFYFNMSRSMQDIYSLWTTGTFTADPKTKLLNVEGPPYSSSSSLHLPGQNCMGSNLMSLFTYILSCSNCYSFTWVRLFFFQVTLFICFIIYIFVCLTLLSIENATNRCKKEIAQFLPQGIYNWPRKYNQGEGQIQPQIKGK